MLQLIHVESSTPNKLIQLQLEAPVVWWEHLGQSEKLVGTFLPLRIRFPLESDPAPGSRAETLELSPVEER